MRPAAKRAPVNSAWLRAIRGPLPPCRQLGDQHDGVAEFVHEIGKRMGIEGDELANLREAASLQDRQIGNPRWNHHQGRTPDRGGMGFMRRHTLIGERILSAAPALRRAA
jgi:hypothetical protein